MPHSYEFTDSFLMALIDKQQVIVYGVRVLRKEHYLSFVVNLQFESLGSSGSLKNWLIAPSCWPWPVKSLVLERHEANKNGRGDRVALT